MIEVIVVLILVCFAWAGGYVWGFAAGEKAEFRKWSGK